jgi:subtilisin family serine protease
MFKSMKLSLAAGITVFTVSVCVLPPTAFAAHDPDSILVKVKPGTSVRALAKRHGMKVRRYIRPIHWVELEPRNQGGATVSVSKEALGNRVEADPAVRSVDTADQGEKVEWAFVPRDPIFKESFKDGTQAAWHFFLPNFPAAWEQSQGGGINVAVIDSEFDTSNPDLRDKIVNTYNDASGTPAYHTGNVTHESGDVFHGSHTAGLVGAKTDNGLGVGGACFECGIVAIKVGSQSTGGTFVDASFLGDVAEALLYAANSGARVVSMSLGGPRPHQPLLDAVNYAASKGLVIAHYPAAYPNVIAVGATDKEDQIAPFSSVGPYVDLAAPGVGVLSTVNASDPDHETPFESKSPKVAIGVKSGTSMSTPIVAGLAGLMLSVRPDLTPPEVEGLMEATARDLGIVGRDPVYGYGRIEADAAVTAAKAYVRPLPPAPAPAPAAAPAPTKKRKKIRRIGARVLLEVKHRKGKAIFFGKVATKPRCKRKRNVVLLAKGSFRPIGRTKTSKRGGFHFKVRGRLVRHKKVRAIVRAKKQGRTVVCKGSLSRFSRG